MARFQGDDLFQSHRQTRKVYVLVPVQVELDDENEIVNVARPLRGDVRRACDVMGFSFGDQRFAFDWLAALQTYFTTSCDIVVSLKCDPIDIDHVSDDDIIAAE